MGASGGFLRAAIACAALGAIAAANEDPRSDRLARQVDAILARKELAGASVGIDVRSVTCERRVLARASGLPLAPASNLKLLTSYLALSILGPDFEFETPLVADGPIVAEGRLEGDLWVIGRGDPTLQPCFLESEDDAAALQPFVQALALQGVRSIRGDLVVDARAFDGEPIPEGWPEDQLEFDYAAPVSALSLNGNCVRVQVASGSGGSPRAELRPAVHGWRLQNDLVAAPRARTFEVGVLRPGADGLVRVRGSVGAEVGVSSVRVTVPDPPRFFGLALRSALAQAGIALGGEVRGPEDNERPGDGARTLFTRRSPLLPALRMCGKESDNHVAEQVLRACALARSGTTSAPACERLALELADELGVPADGLRVADGSGLSRRDRVSAELIATLLAHAYEMPWRDEFIRCLPISGVDGTLEKRMTEPEMRYRVRAKTGYIAQVSGLSGYAMSGEGEDSEVFAFSILVNGFRGPNAEMKQVQDDLCRAIVALPRATP